MNLMMDVFQIVFISTLLTLVTAFVLGLIISGINEFLDGYISKYGKEWVRRKFGNENTKS